MLSTIRQTNRKLVTTDDNIQIDVRTVDVVVVVVTIEVDT